MSLYVLDDGPKPHRKKSVTEKPSTNEGSLTLLLEKIETLLNKQPQQIVVNPPEVTVHPPEINFPKEEKRPSKWKFTLTKDARGNTVQIIAEALTP
jgi:hypothetical protein